MPVSLARAHACARAGRRLSHRRAGAGGRVRRCRQLHPPGGDRHAGDARADARHPGRRRRRRSGRRQYVTFKAMRGDTLVGYAIIVEEIGKHRPITFVVGVRPDGTVNDVAVMAYREAYGGEVKTKRFLAQYRGKRPRDRLADAAATSRTSPARRSRSTPPAARSRKRWRWRRWCSARSGVMTRLAVLLVALLAALAPLPRSAVTEVHYVMGTYFRITADARGCSTARAALQPLLSTTRAAGGAFSRFDAQSELSRLNANADTGRAVSAEMAALLRRALALTTATGRRVRRRRRGADRALARRDRVAVRRADRARSAAGSVRTLLHRRRARRCTARRGAHRLRWHRQGLGGRLAASRSCAAPAITRALLSFGESSLYALGAPARRRDGRCRCAASTGARALGIADAARPGGVGVGGVRPRTHASARGAVGHIVDPRSGRPLTSPALAVVVAPSATDAEAFSKAC